MRKQNKTIDASIVYAFSAIFAGVFLVTGFLIKIVLHQEVLNSKEGYFACRTLQGVPVFRWPVTGTVCLNTIERDTSRYSPGSYSIDGFGSFSVRDDVVCTKYVTYEAPYGDLKSSKCGK